MTLRKWLAIIVVMMMALVSCGSSKEKVARVIDGDTIEMASGERVRLMGIDTPEKRRTGYQEAKDYLIHRLLGKEVKLDRIKKREKYGRTLAYVYLDGKNINQEMIDKGYAKPYFGGKKR